MKKLNLLFLLIFVSVFSTRAQQDTIRSLIISEWRGDAMTSAYLELTNVGDATIDLNRFTLATITPGLVYPTADSRHQKRLTGELTPGASYLIMTVYEGLTGAGNPIHRPDMLPLADLKVYVQEAGVESDSVSTYDRLLRLWNGIYSSVLFFHLDNGDSVIVDAVNNDIDINTGRHKGVPGSVAGVESAVLTHILVRKANIKRGNPNWDNARGVSLEDSEWLPVPHDGANFGGAIYTTVKVHGDYSISLQSQKIGINLTDTILSVPWGIWKGDSLVLNELTLGPNMAWRYHESPVSEDSAYNITRTGDKLTLYALGNQLQKMDFRIMVPDPAQDMALVFPRRNYSVTNRAWSMGSAYYVTNLQTVMDTIGNVPFATRTDTLFNLLHKAPGASWEIIRVDEVERVDLKHGDKLKVTAPDGTTVKEYFIDVLEFVASSNAQIGAITWPDKGSLFLEGWKADTIPFFEPGRLSYSIRLPYETTNVPALKAYPQNMNAKIAVTRATSLKGSIQERTTTFHVTSQNDSSVLTYSVLFELEALGGQQEFRGEPFFSQIIHNHFNQNTFFEIFNPGNVPLDLSQYIVVQTNAAESPAEALQRDIIATEASWGRRYYKYVPGFRFEPLEDWITRPGMLKLDPAINPTLDPGEVFIIGRLHTNPDRRPAEQGQVNIHFSNNLANVWGETGWSQNAMCWIGQNPTAQIFLFKIENDSVLDGKKSVGDPGDYTLIDMFGYSTGEIWNVAGISITGQGWSFKRKSPIWKGNPVSGGSFGTNPDDSEWTVISGAPWPPVSEGLGSHAIDPVTVYVSTISSLTFIVSDGFEDLQTIQGELSGMTLETFYTSISKGHPDQELSLKSGTDGSIKNLTDLVAGDDTLTVVSADGSNSTHYLLINQSLDNNAVLVPKDGSGYTVEINGNTGKITGMEYGTPIGEILEKLIKPENAILNVIDGDNNLIPLRTRVTSSDYVDGTWVYSYEYIDTRTGNNQFFQVEAQDGVTVITYTLEPSVQASDAFVVSSVYQVDQDSLVISGIPFGTSVETVFKNIHVARGATAKITDKAGFKREMGTVWWDDVLVVTSEDQSKTVTYFLDFLTELNPDRKTGDPVYVDHAKPDTGHLTLYPNPTNDRFYLKGTTDKDKVYVTDLMGRMILIAPAKDIQDGISLQEQPSGIYIVVAVDGENIRRARVMKR